jgi:hypothetical protein
VPIEDEGFTVSTDAGITFNFCFVSASHYFQNWNRQFATGWFFSEHVRRTVQPIDEPNPQGDSPNPVQEWFLSRLY